MVKTARKNNSY